MCQKYMTWQEAEQYGFDWFKQHYDPNAILLGGSDSTHSDIQSALYGMIEIKKSKAQCGQFTRSTADDNPLSRIIMAKARENVTCEDARAWCRYHYLQLGVKYVLIIYPNKTIKFMSMNDFFDNWKFKLESRKTKESGSNPAPIYSRKIFSEVWGPIIIDGKKSFVNKNHIGKTMTIINTKGDIRTLLVNEKCEVRILSEIKNETWIFQLDGEIK